MSTPVHRTLVYCLFFFTCAIHTRGQMINHSIQLSGGYSTHGTGDMPGFSAEVGYDHVFNKRFDMTHALTTTIHSSKDALFGTPDPSLPPRDMGLNFTTAGIQITSMGHFAPISVKEQKFKLGAGAIFRYQSSSQPNSYGISRDP